MDRPDSNVLSHKTVKPVLPTGCGVVAVTCTQETHKKLMWPWPLTCDLDIQLASRGCHGTRSRKISSS